MEAVRIGLTHPPNLKRLDAFLSVGQAGNQQLLDRRLLGIIQGLTLEDEVDRLLAENLGDLDFKTLKENATKLEAVVKRFFNRDDVSVTEVHPYFDRRVQAPKNNVLIIKVDFAIEKRFVVLKSIEEGPRRESLAMRINNILTDSPIPFMQSDSTSLQMGIRGLGLDEYPELEKEENLRAFNLNLGKADEFARLIALGDRKAEDLIQLGTGVSHVDFGAAFSIHESIERFVYKDFFASFAEGQAEGRRLIKRRYKKHKKFVDALLGGLDDDFVEVSNSEDKRKLFPVSGNPAAIVYSYLDQLEAT